MLTPHELARQLAVEPIERWGDWVILLLQALEMETMDIDEEHPLAVELLVFEKLRDALTDRLDNHQW